MAMNKSEQELLANALKARDLARALRWPEGMPPTRDVKAPEHSCDWSDGWDFNLHIATNGSLHDVERGVYQAWSRSNSHGFGRHAPGLTGSQGARSLFSTKARALQALRHSAIVAVAEKIAKIDSLIEAESANVT